MVSRFFISKMGDSEARIFRKNKSIFNMKKILSVFLCLAMYMLVFGHDFEVDGIYYNIIGNGQVEVTRDSSYSHWYSGAITIPPSVKYGSTTYTVISIGTYAFHGCGLTTITIPSSVISIGKYAFYSCVYLTSVTMNIGLTTIDECAFLACEKLASVTIPGSVTKIGDCAFESCRHLKSVTIDNGVTSIEKRAFMNCLDLEHIIIPQSMISIGEDAFSGCMNIADITCRAIYPPAIKSNTFSNYDALVFVPANSVDTYSEKIYWENFFIYPLQDEPTALEYNLADKKVNYFNGKIYNEDGLDIKLFDLSGKMISSSSKDIEMSNCPNGIYVLTDGKGGYLKINHYK